MGFLAGVRRTQIKAGTGRYKKAGWMRLGAGGRKRGAAQDYLVCTYFRCWENPTYHFLTLFHYRATGWLLSVYGSDLSVYHHEPNQIPPRRILDEAQHGREEEGGGARLFGLYLLQMLGEPYSPCFNTFSLPNHRLVVVCLRFRSIRLSP